MAAALDVRTVASALRQPYDRQAWVTQLLPSLFTSLQIGARPTPMEVPSNEWEKSFDSAAWLGSAGVTDDQGRPTRVWFAELRLKDSDRLRARLTLRRGLSRLLGAGEVEAVLAFFVTPDGAYRATFAAAEWDLHDGKIRKRETPPKRFSFALGPSEQVKTAAQRLAWLTGRRDGQRFQDVVEAFSVERLNKAFFEGYKERFRALTSAVASPLTAKCFGLEGTNDPIQALTGLDYKPVRDFVKRMMGRIVFLKFVQRKGWLGADPAEPAGVFENGDQGFLKRIIDAYPEQNPYAHTLATLFFETLNTERVGEICPLTGRKVPYLNSGLFDPEPLNPATHKNALLQHKALQVPSAPLQEFMTFLEEFNFTVDENSPDDSEIGVDPEMLGHIFENLLEDNKEKGAFYTPKSVVSFMCQESLLAYLERLFGAREELANLVKLHDVGDWNSDKNWLKRHAAEIYEALERVQICDPACGSGAFPMGMLNEIFWIRYSLRPVKECELPDLRKSIIRNNLHGVDLDANAVEIARLRFWLSIVVDSDQPEPLPNLEFRFLQGNSLVGFLGGEHEWAARFVSGDASETENQFSLGLPDTIASERVARFGREKNRITALIEEHFRTTGARKDALAAEILASERKFVIDILKHARTDIQKLKPSKRNQARTAALDRRINLLGATKPGENRDYFPWLFYEDAGFDIVLANPPYISAIDHKKTYGDDARAALKETYSTASGAFDLYVCFFELAANLLVDGGVLTFITPNKWLSVSYGEGLRNYFAERMDVRSITDLSSVAVFKSASVYPVISVVRKGTASRRGYVEISVGSDVGNGDVRMTALPAAPNELLDALPGKIWGFLLDPRRALLAKLLARSVWLRDIAQVNALTTAGEAEELGGMLAEDEKAKLRVANTGTLDPYVCLWGERALVKQGRKFLHPTFKGTSPALTSRKQLFETPKIVVAKMALRCEAFLDERGIYAGLDVNAIYAPQGNYNLPFILGYLHSDCATFAHRLFFRGLVMSGGYLPFQAPHLRVLPIPDLTRPGGKRLAELVERAVERTLHCRAGISSAEEAVNEALAAFYDLNAAERQQLRELAEVEIGSPNEPE